jgi:xanthine permease XanP
MRSASRRASDSLMTRRPDGLIYGLDDEPRPLLLAALGLQHFMVVAPNLAIVVMICRAAGVDATTTEGVLSFSLIALAVATLLQGSRRFGSGYFIVSCNSGIYLSASLAAAAEGLPVVFGMTVLAGVFQAFFAGLLVRARRFFPDEIVALSIIIVGIELGVIGLNRLSGAGAPGLMVGGVTFFVSVVFGVFGKGGWRLYCSLLGMLCGYLLCLFAGITGPGAAGDAFSSALFGLPAVSHLGPEFDADFALPFIFAAIAASLKTMGAVNICARINDAAWVRPEMRAIRRGMLVDGLSTALAGLFGSTGTNSSTSSIGVSQASGATSRVIGVAAAAWMILFAFSPTFTHLVVNLPDPVVGGMLVFTGSLVIANGFQILGTVPMDMQRAGVVAFPLLVAIARLANAPLFAQLPDAVKPLMSSALAIGVFTALVVNVFLSWGKSRRATLFLDPVVPVGARLRQVQKVLDDWNVAHNVKVRAMLTLRELLDERGASMKLAFNGCTLHVSMTRAGDHDDKERLADGRFFSARVSDAIAHRKRADGTCVVSLYFEQ